MLERLFNISWYGKWQWTWLLWPLSLLVLFITNKKRKDYLANTPECFSVPVIVVGNITIGGTGKTPVVQALVRYLISLGYRPGIVSRGYGGSNKHYPYLISEMDNASLVGDEPYMLFQSLQVPVVIDPVRKQAVERLLQENVNIVISDDGLQHYGLHRDYEVCVVDGSRRLGNKQIMPVGPLRETLDRINSVDYVLTSSNDKGGNTFQIEPMCWVNLKTEQQINLADFKVHTEALAIAGIGNPEKFRQTLLSLGVNVPCKWFVDHHDFTIDDFKQLPQHILMTEKDAAKIKPFATEYMWYLKISANLPNNFKKHLNAQLTQWESSHG